MITVAIILCLILTITFIFFVSRRFSPIPYFPSNKNDLKNIVKALGLRNGQIVYDLGAGDGVVIFTAALEALRKDLNTKFVAVEINPILLMVLWVRRLFHPNRKNIRILYADIFSLRYTLHATRYTIFAYVSPWYLERILNNVRSQIKKFDWISYYYPLPERRSSTVTKGVHTVYKYVFELNSLAKKPMPR